MATFHLCTVIYNPGSKYASCLKAAHQVAISGKLGRGFSFHFRDRKTSSERKLLADVIILGRNRQRPALDHLSVCNCSINLFVSPNNYVSLEMLISESSCFLFIHFQVSGVPVHVRCEQSSENTRKPPVLLGCQS